MRRPLRIVCVAVGLWTSLAGAVAAGTGDLDPTFGTGGGTTVAVGAQAFGDTGLIQPDGRIVAIGRTAAVAGDDLHVFLARFESNGTLDATFGTGGVAVSGVLADDSFFLVDAKLQPSGKIVVVAAKPSHDPMILRFDADGALDVGFGTGGIVEPPVAVTDLTLDVRPDGRILSAGWSNPFYTIELFQWDPDGMLDATFGTAGVAADPLGYSVAGVGSADVGPDGKLVVQVLQGNVSGITLRRYETDGTHDLTFGPGGEVSDLSQIDARVGVLVQPDGKVLAGGYADGQAVAGHPDQEFLGDQGVLVRYDVDGSRDTTFGFDGVRGTGLGGPSSTLPALLYPDGRILAVAGFGPGSTRWARYMADGSLDPTFAAGGKLRGNFGALRQSDGKLVGVGTAGTALRVERYDGECPSLPDSDGDGIGDACDPCSGGPAATRVALDIGNTLAPPADDTMHVRGQLELADSSGIDPLTTGILLLIQDATDAVVQSVLIPGGPRLPVTGVGWTSKGGTTFTYSNPGVHHTATPSWVEGVRRASVKLNDVGAVRFRFRGKAGNFPVDPAHLPLHATLVLTPPRSATGRCGTLTFPSCSFDAVHARVRCK